MTSTGARHVSLLRGINVGGNNKLPMAWLREAYEAVGCEDVSTYLQSGNVVFRRNDPAKVGDEVADVIKKDLGFTIAMVDRSHDELVRVVADDPFPDADQGQRVVVFLSDPLPSGKLEELQAVATAREAVEVGPRELHLHCQDGLGRSKLAAASGKKNLGVIATGRNWRTVLALVELSRPT